MCDKEAKPTNHGVDSAELLITLYDELRRIAARQLARLGGASTLQPTAVVHEVWLRIGGHDASNWRDQAHFIAAATEAMRHILIDRARRRQAIRHGGGQQRVHVDVDHIEVPWAMQGDEELLALDEELKKLSLEHPGAAALVKLHCFAGLDVSEAGRLLGLTRSAAYRRWLFARAWLEEELYSNV